jgi:hypothetical protein
VRKHRSRERGTRVIIEAGKRPNDKYGGDHYGTENEDIAMDVKEYRKKTRWILRKAAATRNPGLVQLRSPATETESENPFMRTC